MALSFFQYNHSVLDINDSGVGPGWFRFLPSQVSNDILTYYFSVTEKQKKKATHIVICSMTIVNFLAKLIFQNSKLFETSYGVSEILYANIVLQMIHVQP